MNFACLRLISNLMHCNGNILEQHELQCVFMKLGKVFIINIECNSTLFWKKKFLIIYISIHFKLHKHLSWKQITIFSFFSKAILQSCCQFTYAFVFALYFENIIAIATKICTHWCTLFCWEISNYVFKVFLIIILIRVPFKAFLKDASPCIF